MQIQNNENHWIEKPDEVVNAFMEYYKQQLGTGEMERVKVDKKDR